MLILSHLGKLHALVKEIASFHLVTAQLEGEAWLAMMNSERSVIMPLTSTGKEKEINDTSAKSLPLHPSLLAYFKDLSQRSFQSDFDP